MERVETAKAAQAAVQDSGGPREASRADAQQAPSLYVRFGFKSAYELFRAVMDAARDLEDVARQMELVKSRTGLHAQRYDLPRGRSGHSDPTAAAAELAMKQEDRLCRRADLDRELIAYGTEVCYGMDGTGGVFALLGGRHADALYSRYCLAHPWRGVAADMGMSQHGVRNLIGVALDMVESCGADRVRLEGAAANVASSTGEAVCAGAGA